MDSTAPSIVVERKVCMNNFASQILHLDMFQRGKRSCESKKRRKKAHKEKNASKLKQTLEPPAAEPGYDPKLHKPVELSPELTCKFTMRPSEFSPLPVGIVESEHDSTSETEYATQVAKSNLLNVRMKQTLIQLIGLCCLILL